MLHIGMHGDYIELNLMSGPVFYSLTDEHYAPPIQ